MSGKLLVTIQHEPTQSLHPTMAVFSAILRLLMPMFPGNRDSLPAQSCYSFTCMGHWQEDEVDLCLKGFSGIKGQESLTPGPCLWNWRTSEQESKSHLLSPWWSKPTLLAQSMPTGETLPVSSGQRRYYFSPKETRRNGSCPSSRYWQTPGTGKNSLMFLILCVNLLEPGNNAHWGSKFAHGDSEHLEKLINPSYLSQIKVFQMKRKRGLSRMAHGFTHTSHTTPSMINRTKGHLRTSIWPKTWTLMILPSPTHVPWHTWLPEIFAV